MKVLIQTPISYYIIFDLVSNKVRELLVFVDYWSHNVAYFVRNCSSQLDSLSYSFCCFYPFLKTPIKQNKTCRNKNKKWTRQKQKLHEAKTKNARNYNKKSVFCSVFVECDVNDWYQITRQNINEFQLQIAIIKVNNRRIKKKL